MQVKKENKIMVYKSEGGKLDVYMNINGQQLRSRVFPNIEDDMSIRSWGGNVYDNTPEEE